MSTRSQLKHPLIATETSRRVLRARLSLRETQTEFAARFLVTRLTVHNWETGKSVRMQPIHNRVLDSMLQNLKEQGRLIEDALFETMYRETAESRGIDERLSYQN